MVKTEGGTRQGAANGFKQTERFPGSRVNQRVHMLTVIFAKLQKIEVLRETFSSKNYVLTVAKSTESQCSPRCAACNDVMLEDRETVLEGKQALC